MEANSHVLLVSGNAFIKKDGCLVMGRGAAFQLKVLFPRIDKLLGRAVRKIKKQTSHDAYGVAYVNYFNSPIGVFQVKHNFFEDAKLEIIASSVDVLCRLANEDWKGRTIAMNFPGISNGNLKRADVLPLIMRLPDNIEVWEGP